MGDFFPCPYRFRQGVLYYTNRGVLYKKGGVLYTRKVEALGGHLFVPGQVGGVGIQKTRCQNFGNFKTHACLNFQPNWFNITTTSMEKTETGSMNAKGQPVMVMINNWIFHRKSIGQGIGYYINFRHQIAWRKFM